MSSSVDELRRQVDALIWFHSIDFGNGIVSNGRKTADELALDADLFFGSISIRGRTLLDIGTWNGFFSFEARRRGASRVLATDKYVWRHPILRGREGFDLARSHLSYEIEAREIDVSELTIESVGPFEVVLFAGVFYHLFEAPKLLKQISELATKVLVVETHQDLQEFSRPAMAYYPGTSLLGDETNFWGPNSSLMYHLLSEAGFRRIFYRPHPRHANTQMRGVYLAFRDEAAMEELSFAAGAWRDLQRESGSADFKFRFVAARTPRNFLNFMRKRPLDF